MSQLLSKSELHTLLRNQGHAFWNATVDETPICVSPPVDTYITVALEVDGTLKQAYRDRYFACLCDENDDPLILHESGFGLREPFATIAAHRPANNSFMLGPFRWLLARMSRFRRLLLWPKDGFGRNGGKPLTLLPALTRLIEQLKPEQIEVGALRLETANPADAEVLWEIGELVGSDVYDFYLSDESGKEVYLLHHHDKIVISIPNSVSRDELMAELDGLDELFEDCSGYRFSAE